MPKSFIFIGIEQYKHFKECFIIFFFFYPIMVSLNPLCSVVYILFPSSFLSSSSLKLGTLPLILFLCFCGLGQALNQCMLNLHVESHPKSYKSSNFHKWYD